MKRVLTLALLLLLAVPAAAGSPPREYTLPGTDVFPEGVTLRPGTDQFFVSSTVGGAIYRGTLGKPRLRTFLPGGGDGRTFANGLHATRDHLFVAGSVRGYVFVYDIRSGRLVRRFATGTNGLINDLTVGPGGDVYVTDSTRGLLFHIPAAAATRRTTSTRFINPMLRFGDTPVGLYSNGIVAAGRRHLLVVGTASGVLARVDLRTKRVRRVRGVELPGGDGLARSGRTLYAVNSASKVTQLQLSRDWRSARVVRDITSPTFRFPTTVAIAGNRLLVVNSQFDKRGATPVLPFTVSAVRRP